MAGRSGLSHVTAGEHCPVRHVASRLEDEVAGDDPFAHEGRGSGVAAHGAVFQPCRPVEDGARADTHVPQPAAVEDAGAHSDASPFAALLFRILAGHPADGLREARVVAVHGLHVGFLRREAFVHDDFPPAAFAHDGQLHAVAERRAGGHGQYIGVQDDAFRPDVVVRDIAMDMFDEAVVAHGRVVERGMADARPARHAAGEGEVFSECPDAVRSGEMHVFHLPQVGAGTDFHPLPVFSRAALSFQLPGFVRCQLPVCRVVFSCFHCLL